MIVIHYVQNWLPISAGFVHSHVRHSRHRAIVVTRERAENRKAFPHRPVVSLGRLPSRAGRAATAGVAALARSGITHVHFGYAVDDVLPAVRRRGLRVVLSLHGDDALALPREKPHHYDAALEHVDAVVVPSEFLVPAAASIGVAPDRIVVVPAGVDTTFFRPSPLPAGKPEALFVGRFVEKKGLDVLLAAWPMVRAAVSDARLRIIGSGPLETLVDRAAGQNGISVERPDPARRSQQVRDAIRAAWVVVQPSRTASNGDAETLLVVNLEAQASGRAVVTTRHGGIPEYVGEGTTALVVPENDPGALAEQLAHLLGDRAEAARLGAAGPDLAADYDVRRCSARIDDLYEQVMAGQRLGRGAA